MALDLRKISKAIAGGVAAATGGTTTAIIIIPATVNLSPTLLALIPLANFVIGFAFVYFAPSNTAPQPPGA